MICWINGWRQKIPDVSHHFAMYRDAGLTAKNLGHPSPTLLRKDYNNAVTRAEAERFWSIAPWG